MARPIDVGPGHVAPPPIIPNPGNSIQAPSGSNIYLATLVVVDPTNTVAVVALNNDLPLQSGYSIPADLGVKFVQAPNPVATAPAGVAYYNNPTTNDGGSFVYVDVSLRKIISIGQGVSTTPPVDPLSMFQFIKHNGLYNTTGNFQNPGLIDNTQLATTPSGIGITMGSGDPTATIQTGSVGGSQFDVSYHCSLYFVGTSDLLWLDQVEITYVPTGNSPVSWGNGGALAGIMTSVNWTEVTSPLEIFGTVDVFIPTGLPYNVDLWCWVRAVDGSETLVGPCVTIQNTNVSIQRQALESQGAPGPTNILYNPTFSSGFDGWLEFDISGGSQPWVTDGFAGGRAIWPFSTASKSSYKYQDCAVFAGQPMTLSGVLELGGTPSIPVGGSLTIEVYDTTTSTVLASYTATHTTALGRIPINLPFNTGSLTSVQVRLVGTTGTSTASIDGFIYKLQLQYGPSTAWVDHSGVANSTLLFNSTGYLKNSTTLNNSTPNLAPTGTPGVSAVGSYPSGGSPTVTVSWTGGSGALFPNGNIYAIDLSVSSQAFTGLVANTLYYFVVYLVLQTVSGTTKAYVNIDGPYTSLPTATQAYFVSQDGNIGVSTGLSCRTPASVGGSSTGGGGGGTSCPAAWTKVICKELGITEARNVQVGMHLMGPDGNWKEVLKTKLCWGDLFRIVTNDAPFDVDSMHYWKSADDEWIRVTDLTMSTPLIAPDSKLYLPEKIERIDQGEFIKMLVVDHEFVVVNDNGVELIAHNVQTL